MTAQRETLTTPPGLFLWPHLQEPDTKFGDPGEFKVTLVLPSAEEETQALLAKLEAAYDENVAAQAEAKGKKKIKTCQKPWQEEEDDEGNPTGRTRLRFKMKPEFKSRSGETIRQVPKLFGANARPFDVPEDNAGNPQPMWTGTEGRLSFRLYPWWVDSQGAGITLQLKAAQILKFVSGDSGDGSSYGFDVEEGEERSEEDDFVNEGDILSADDM